MKCSNIPETSSSSCTRRPYIGQYKSKESYAQRAQTSADPEDPDFGLWTSGSEAWSGSPPILYHLVLEPCPTPPKNFVKIRSQVASALWLTTWSPPYRTDRQFASNPTDRQTHRQTDRTKNITSFLGGGNNVFIQQALLRGSTHSDY